MRAFKLICFQLVLLLFLILSTKSFAIMDIFANPTNDVPRFTDKQITQIMLTINEGEIAAGQIAAGKTKNQEVKTFAEDMVKEHKNNLKATKDVAKKTNSEPEETNVSKGLKAEADKGNQDLKATMNDFDKAYLDQQIAMHEKALSMIEGTLMPNATFVEIRNHLEQTRNAVSKHLAHAKNLRNKL